MNPCCPRNADALLHLVKLYDYTRLPIANHIQKTSRKQGYYNELNMPEFEDVHDEGHDLNTQQILALGNALRENWSWWEDCAEYDLEQMLELQRAGVFNNKNVQLAK